ncbi:uncharacterized protein LOC108110577 [Drosophila eugracilis]|uniref:uncharacterized protein LOC108110577 n=1 Tax=Drosophila eugracilis TaxID=29029 RepID=UPI001BDAAC00|nr:uncharacterized protein LOC108110577 [Drosophila eugracilis]
MFGGSLLNSWNLWPPALQLLNFPSHQQQEQNPRPTVHFEYPPGHQLQLRPRRIRAPRTVPEGDASRSQESGNGPTQEELFVRRCYMMAGLFTITMAILVMILSKAIPPGYDLMIPGFICTFLSLMFLFVLCIAPVFRRFYWISFTLSGLFVTLSGLGVIFILQERNLVNICIALVVASTVTVICYLAGACLPKIVLPGETTMLLLVIVFVLASVFVLIMFILTIKKIYQTVYFILMVTILIPTSVYQAELVHGRRFKLPDYEFVFCADTVYLHFLLFFVAFYYLIWNPNW